MLEDEDKDVSSERNVLCIGFSVTEQNSSYVPVAQSICESEGLLINFHKCAIGGIGAPTLEYIIDDILDMHSSFPEIIFELSTGKGRNEVIERNLPNDVSLIRCIKAIADAALRRGKLPRFLNLPRLDVEYSRDPLELAIMFVAVTTGCPARSISYESLLDNVELSKYLPDNVHVNSEGAEYYARGLIGLATQDAIRNNQYVPATRESFSLEFANNSASFAVFERHGYGVRTVAVEEGGALELWLGDDVELVGVTFMCGPTCGKFDIVLDDVWLDKVDSYDEYCYYERFNSVFICPTKGSKLSVILSSDQSDTKPLKGEKDFGARKMSFVHALFRKA